MVDSLEGGYALDEMIHNIYIKYIGFLEYEAPSNASWVKKRICAVKNQFKSTCVQNQWLDGSKSYTISEAYKWLIGEQVNVSWYHWVGARPIYLTMHLFLG